MRNQNLIFFFLNQNICGGYSKEPSQLDGSFEHPKHMLKLMNNNIQNFAQKCCSQFNISCDCTTNSYFSLKMEEVANTMVNDSALRGNFSIY